MKRNSGIIFWGAVLIWISMYVYVPVLSTYASSLGASPSMVGLISGIYGFLPIFLCAILGFIAGVSKDKLYLIIGFIVVSLSALILFLNRNVTGLLIGRAVAAAASGWWVILAAAYTKYQPEEREVKAQGLLNFGSNFGKMVGCVICMFVAGTLGMPAIFFIALIAGIVGLVLMCCLKKAPLAPAAAKPVPFRTQLKLFGKKDMLRFSLLAALAQMLSFAVPVTFTPIAADSLGADDFILSLIQVIYVISVALSCLFVGTKPYKKIGGIGTLTIAFVCGAISCLPFMYGNYFSISVMQILSGISYGIALGALSGFVVRMVGPEQRTAALGVFESLYSIGIFVGPTIAGGLVEYLSFDGAYWAFLGISVLGAVLCPVLIPKKYSEMG